MSNYAIIDIPTIKGQSTLEGFKDKLELLSYSLGVSLPVTGIPSNSERTKGRPHFQELNVTRYSDSATPALLQVAAGGTVLVGDTVLTIARNDEKGATLPLLIYTLTNVVVSNISISGGGGDLPVETFSLAYDKIKVAYHVQNAAGGQKGVAPFTYNLATNKP